MKRKADTARILCGLVAWLVTGGVPYAASLSVAPIRVELSARHPIAALTVRNDGDAASVVQLETMHWAQDGGKDVYTATQDLLATPPVFSVPAHASQVVRVGLRHAPASAQELSYRLYLQEVPAPAPATFQGMRVVLRFGVPVFVGAAAEPVARPALEWSARTVPGKTVVVARNAGVKHVEVTHLTVASAGAAKPLFAGDVQSYLLPGQQHEWTLDGEAAAPGPLHVSAASDAGAFASDIAVAH